MANSVLGGFTDGDQIFPRPTRGGLGAMFRFEDQHS